MISNQTYKKIKYKNFMFFIIKILFITKIIDTSTYPDSLIIKN